MGIKQIFTRLSLLAACLVVATGELTYNYSYAAASTETERALQERVKLLEAKLARIEGPKVSANTDMSDVLPNAKAGQCFAKVLVPAEYKTVKEKVIVHEAAHKIEVIPPKYELVTNRVVTKEASEKIVEIPAVYEKVKEKVLIEPAQKIWRQSHRNRSKLAPAAWVNAALSSGISKDAAIGNCYEEVFQAAKYDTVEEKMLKRQEGTRIEIIPAKYEWIEKKVVVKEASEKIVDIPATYSSVKEKILKQAAYTTWKKGRGPIERINNSTGEIMCLVEVPAKYKVITKNILKTSATTKKIPIPAEYKTIRIRKLVSAAKEKVIKIPAEYQTLKKKVKANDEVIGWRPENTVGIGSPTGKKICRMEIPAKYRTITKEVIKNAATTKKVAIPASYKQIKVRKLVSAAQQKKIDIPAKYQTISKRVKVSDEQLAWRDVLCETNTSRGLIVDIQKALKKTGFNPGPIDGVMGRQTHVAIDLFQKKKGFERGGVTLRTLAALGVKVDR